MPLYADPAFSDVSKTAKMAIKVLQISVSLLTPWRMIRIHRPEFQTTRLTNEPCDWWNRSKNLMITLGSLWTMRSMRLINLILSIGHLWTIRWMRLMEKSDFINDTYMFDQQYTTLELLIFKTFDAQYHCLIIIKSCFIIIKSL